MALARGFFVLVALGATLVAAQSNTLIDGTLLEQDICYSSTEHLRIGTANVGAEPNARIVIFDRLPQAPKVSIACIHVLEVAGTSAIARDTQCNAQARVHLCKAPVDDPNWDCEELFEYTFGHRVAVERGTINGNTFRWRIELDLSAKASSCYPRTVQMVAVIADRQRVEGNWVLFGFVIAFLVLVAICIGIFAFYAIRKHVSKVNARYDAPIIASPMQLQQEQQQDGEGGELVPLPVTDAEFAPQPLPIAEVRSMYMQSEAAKGHVLGPDGALSPRYVPEDHLAEHIAKSTREAAELARRPSLYEKSFTKTLETTSQAPPVVVWSPTEHPEAMEPGTTIPIDVLEKAQRSPRRFNPLHRGTIVCADCHAVVQEETTVRICPVSGKRHF